MKLKSIFVLMLALCMVFTLCACGGNADEGKESTTGTTAGTTETTEATVDDGKVTYTVKVVDEGGNAVIGAIVQLCKDSCLPCPVDANGVATWNLVEDDYKASFVQIPEGYTADATEFYFDAGSYEMTITLKAVA